MQIQCTLVREDGHRRILYGTSPANFDRQLDDQPVNHLPIANADNADEDNPFHKAVCFILNLTFGGRRSGDLLPAKYSVRSEADWMRVNQAGNLDLE